MICRHHLLLIVRVLAVSTYFMLCYFLLHVLLLVYSAHLVHYAAYIISDLCIAFYVCRTTCDWFLALEFRFYRPQRAWWRYAMNCLRDAYDALEAPVRDLKVQPSL